MGNLFRYSYPSSCEFNEGSLTFYTYKGSRYEENYRELNSFLKENYGIQDENYRSCKPVSISGGKNLFFAAVAILKEGWLGTSFRNSSFQKYCVYAIEQRDRLATSESNDPKVGKFDRFLLDIVVERNTFLLLQNKRFRKIAEKFAIQLEPIPELQPREAASDFEKSKAIVEQNAKLMLQNEALHSAVIEKARQKTREYNDQACRATIAAVVMQAIRNNTDINLNAIQQQLLIEECRRYHFNYDQMDVEQQLRIQKQIGANLAPIPSNGQVHEYINPEEIFPAPSTDDNGRYVTFNDTSYNSSNRISTLESNVDRIFSGLAVTTGEVSRFIRFWLNIKFLLNSVWQLLKETLGNLRAKGDLGSHMDLADNVENIVEKRDVTQNAQLIHKFNSQPSPIIAIIYDKQLSEEEKFKLINIIACEKKYGQKRNNIDIDAGDDRYPTINHRSPLAHAVDKDSLLLVQLLVSKGANINKIDAEKKAPIHRAVVGSVSIEILHYLIGQNADLTIKDKEGRSALHLAVIQGKLAAVKALVEACPDIMHATDSHGNTPLHYVKNANIANYLIGKGAKVDATNNMGGTPLHEIARTQYGRVDYWDSNKFSKEDYFAVFDELLKQSGKVVNQPNRYGYTPLHMALQIGTQLKQGGQYGNIEFEVVLEKIKRLLIAGADSSLVTYEGYDYDSNPLPKMTALMMLFSWNNKSVGSQGVEQYRLEIVAELLKDDKEHNLNLVDSNLDSVLIQAIKQRDVNGVKFLLQQGAKLVYHTGGGEKSSLHEAVKEVVRNGYGYDYKGITQIIAELLKYRADINHRITCNITLNTELVMRDDENGLCEQAIDIIFASDNPISKKAVEMSMDLSHGNKREILRKVWPHLQLQSREVDWFQKVVSLEFSLQLTALEMAYFTEADNFSRHNPQLLREEIAKIFSTTPSEQVSISALHRCGKFSNTSNAAEGGIQELSSYIMEI